MRYHFFDQDVVIPLQFGTAEEPISPDDGSVVYSVRGVGGELVPESAVGAGITEVTIPAVINGSGSGEAHRWVFFRFTSAGESHRITYPYILQDFIPVLVTEKDVRDELGVSAAELGNDSLNILEGVHGASEYVGLPLFEDPADIELHSRLVKAYLCWYWAERLWLRVRHSQQVQSDKVTRSSKVDWGKLVETHKGVLLALSKQIRNVGEGGEEPTLLQFATRDDAVTGE